MALNTSTDAPKRNTFPLPQELRDHIYSYLLVGQEVVREPHADLPNLYTSGVPTERNYRHRNQAHTYDFQTNIMAVNRTMECEARKVLREQNTFLAIASNWPNLRYLAHHYNVPIVAEGKAALSTCHLPTVLVGIRHPSYDRPFDHRFLMLERDFHFFKRMMTWLFLQTPTPFELCVRKQDNINDDARIILVLKKGSSCVQTTITIVPNQSSGKSKKCSDHIKRLAVPAHNVQLIIVGEDGENVDYVPGLDIARIAIGERKVDVASVLWHLSDTMFDLKTEADEMTRNGKYEDAMWRYNAIYEGSAWRQFFIHDHFDTLGSVQTIRHILIQALRQIFDVVAMAYQLQLRKLDHNQACNIQKSVEGELLAMLSNFPVASELERYGLRRFPLDHETSRLRNLIWLARYTKDTDPAFQQFFDSGDLADQHSIIHNSLQETRNGLERAIRSNPNDAHVVHDLGVINPIMENPADLARFYNCDYTIEEVLTRFSTYCLPPKIVNSPMFADIDRTRPGGRREQSE